MKLIIGCSVSLLAYFLISGCSKDETPSAVPQAHVFKGILVTDDVGNSLAEWGTDDGDWDNDSNWTAAEYEALNFADTISLDGTYIRDTTGWNTGTGIHEQPQNIAIAFPNPANYSAMVYAGGYGLLKIKAVLVDEYYQRLQTWAYQSEGTHFNVDLSDTVKYQNGKLYRVLYSFSVADSLNFYKGHGDILICRHHDLMDCEQFVP